MARLERFRAADGLVGFRSPALAALGVPHLFTTASGGLDVARLDAGLARRLARAAGAPDAAVVALRQVHGAAVADGDGDAPEPADADALVASRPDRLCLVRSADCVPLLLAAPGGARVAAVHAGWRGLCAGVIQAALERLGACAAAAIGPCLSLERFEVGPEVADRFRAAELGGAVVERPGARAHVDLRQAARLALARAGVAAVDVSDAPDACTWDGADLYSYRRDVTHGGAARTGSLGALIAARAG